MINQQIGLTNIQLELLKLYGNNISDTQLFEIRKLLADYFAQKGTEAMDSIWENQNLTEEDMKRWINEHNRYEGSN
ncbi:MAG: hypothetical protein HYZ54_10825 [Ignavibacteriae bacterium]|nr:hypothetical protein [Ignavibacteriota bacterium]